MLAKKVDLYKGTEKDPYHPQPRKGKQKGENHQADRGNPGEQREIIQTFQKTILHIKYLPIIEKAPDE